MQVLQFGDQSNPLKKNKKQKKKATLSLFFTSGKTAWIQPMIYKFEVYSQQNGSHVFFHSWFTGRRLAILPFTFSQEEQVIIPGKLYVL